MDKYKKNLMDLEDAAYRLSCGVEILFAIHTAMAEGPFEAGSYTGALYGAYNWLRRDCDEIKGRVEAAIRGNKEEKSA